MRFIHTADWHLGRLFHGVHLTDDQRFILKSFCALVRDSKPDAVLIAGDIYDRAVPPPEAVRLLDDVLSELVLDIGVPVLLIAGNHDSPHRLDFGSRLLAGRRLHVVGGPSHTMSPIVLNDAHGPVHFYLLPFAEPGMVRKVFACEEAVDHDTAMKHILNTVRASADSTTRKVLMGHAFVAGGKGCESERPLSVGTAGTVDASHFHGFDYVALGHLHEPQTVGDPRIRYSGSLLKYSFDEVDHAKSVNIVEMAADGTCNCEAAALQSQRNVRRISGLMSDLLVGSQFGNTDDYLEIIALDDGPVVDAVGRLRGIYPNLLHFGRVQKELPHGEGMRGSVNQNQHRDLFKDFFAHTTGEPLNDAQDNAYVATVEAMLAREREAEVAK